MHSSPRPCHPADSRYWVTHFWLPLLVMALVLTLFEATPLDVKLAGFWYKMEGGEWALRNHWFTYHVMHHWGKRLIIGFGLALLFLYAASWKFERLRRWRWSLLFSLTAMILVPSCVAILKRLSGVPCPWSVQEFGGNLPYLHSFQYLTAPAAGHCFPAAHASSGFGLFALYFAFAPFLAKHRRLLLLPGLIVGFSFGLAQQLRGAHYLSHDLWSATIAWLGLVLMSALVWRFAPPAHPPWQEREA